MHFRRSVVLKRNDRTVQVTLSLIFMRIGSLIIYGNLDRMVVTTVQNKKEKQIYVCIIMDQNHADQEQNICRSNQSVLTL